MKEATVESDSSFLGWAMAAVGTIVSALTGTVAFFYKQQIADYKHNESILREEVARINIRCDKCEIDREELRIRCAVLEARVSKIEDNQGE